MVIGSRYSVTEDHSVCLGGHAPKEAPASKVFLHMTEAQKVFQAVPRAIIRGKPNRQLSYVSLYYDQKIPH